jgi:hypothetical protein
MERRPGLDWGSCPIIWEGSLACRDLRCRPVDCQRTLWKRIPWSWVDDLKTAYFSSNYVGFTLSWFFNGQYHWHCIKIIRKCQVISWVVYPAFLHPICPYKNPLKKDCLLEGVSEHWYLPCPMTLSRSWQRTVQCCQSPGAPNDRALPWGSTLKVIKR